MLHILIINKTIVVYKFKPIEGEIKFLKLSNSKRRQERTKMKTWGKLGKQKSPNKI